MVAGTTESAVPLTSNLLIQGDACNVEELARTGQICEGAGERRRCLNLQKASLQEPCTEVRSSVASFTC